MAEVVVDASAVVDLLLGNETGQAVRRRLTGHGLHAPAHLDAEVLSALGRLFRARELAAEAAEGMLSSLTAAPIARYPVHELVMGAWARRQQLRLADALYVQLAAVNGWTLVTTDRRLAAQPPADVVTA